MSLQAQDIINIPTLANTRTLIIQSKWHKEYSDKMVNCCRQLLAKMGENNEVVVIKLPGCWEIPQYISHVLSKNKHSKEDKDSLQFDAIVLFGIIFKGETYHFDMILNTISASLSKLLLKSPIPIINEILPVTSKEQIIARCGDGDNNKGYEAAIAAAEMINLFRAN